MNRRLRIIWLCLVLILITCNQHIEGQLLKDSVAVNLVRKDINYLYNLQFKEAREVLSLIKKKYPDHPVGFLLKGMITYWENYPLLHTSPSHVSFEDDMRECIRLSELNDKPENEAEFLLSGLCARGMLLMFYDDNDLILEVTPLTISTYKNIRRSFKYVSECTDLYYFTGVYNYYREAYPKAYPVYRSLAFLFPHGNTETGLKQLGIAANKSLLLGAESSFVLIDIFLSFENRVFESYAYSKDLYENHRGNGIYLETYIRNTLLVKNYDEAERLISASPVNKDNKFYQAQLSILKGIIQEKKYHNLKSAQQFYNSGINEISVYGKYGYEFAAYAYFGLSRVSDSNDEKHTRKTYRKEAMKLAQIKKINFDK